VDPAKGRGTTFLLAMVATELGVYLFVASKVSMVHISTIFKCSFYIMHLKSLANSSHSAI